MNVEDWEYEDFKTYLFIYCSFADHLEVEKERNLTIEKMGEKQYKKMHKIIINDTDDFGINKIKKYLKINNLTNEQTNELLKDIDEIFMSDGTFHKLEKRVYNSIKGILEKVHQKIN